MRSINYFVFITYIVSFNPMGDCKIRLANVPIFVELQPIKTSFLKKKLPTAKKNSPFRKKCVI